MASDCELLRQYAHQDDEAAFAEIVRRHVNLVYASAVRLLNGNAALAEDVTQEVFTDLARKAAALGEHTTVAGWLHTSVRFAAANAVRGEQRRRIHEQEASAMSDQSTTPDLAWMQLRPLIDEAVGHLNEPERDAVLLRFFEDMSHREVGDALGLSENTARMRVERGLEKLRAYFMRHGVTATAALLASTLGAQAATSPAPALFSAALADKSLAGAAGAKVVASKTAGAFAKKTLLALVGAAAVATAATLSFTTSEKTSPPPAKQIAAAAPARPSTTAAPTTITPAPNLPAAGVVSAGVVTTTTVATVSTLAEQLATTSQNAASSIQNLDARPSSSTTNQNNNQAADQKAADATTATQSLHEFTNTQGQKMRAEILNVADPEVVLKREDGQTFQVRIDIFIAADQAYIRQWVPAAAAPVIAGPGATALTTLARTTQATSGIVCWVPGLRNAPKGPILVDAAGILNGKTVTMVAGGEGGCWMALCSDGTLASWNYLPSSQTLSAPAAIDTSGALKGEKITDLAITDIYANSYAVCADGTLYSFSIHDPEDIGYDFTPVAAANRKAGLAKAREPVLFNGGALLGRKVTAIVAVGGSLGRYGLALCSDGALVPWSGEAASHDGSLGIGTGLESERLTLAPALHDGVLQDRTIVAVAAAGGHNVVLGSDGTLAHWERPPRGGAEPQSAPDALVDATSLLKGKTVTAIAIDSTWILALCSDGTLAAWGGAGVAANPRRGTARANAARTYPPQSTDAPMAFPVPVKTTGVLEGKTIKSIVGQDQPNGFLILCSDGTLADWDGKLADSPVSLNTDALEGKIVTAIAPGVAVFKDAATPPPSATPATAAPSPAGNSAN